MRIRIVYNEIIFRNELMIGDGFYIFKNMF